MKSPPLHKSLLVMGILVTSVDAWSRPPRISGGGGVVNVVREADPDTTASYRFVVYLDTLAEVPVIFQVSAGLSVDPPNVVAHLRRDRSAWYEQVDVTVEIDGKRVETYGLELMPGSERFQRDFLAAYGKLRFESIVPDMYRFTPSEPIGVFEQGTVFASA